MPTEIWDKRLAHLDVLVVEDELIMRNMVEYALKAMGVTKITPATNGKQALTLVAQSNKAFDLIVSDWKMPVMDGLAFLKELRKSGDKTPFLMLTSMATKEEVTMAAKAGANSYIAKPFSTDNLYKKIVVLMKNRPA